MRWIRRRCSPIYKFFENNLNVSGDRSEAVRPPEHAGVPAGEDQELTGLDLREFDDAITFKVALMVKKYLTSRGIDA